MGVCSAVHDWTAINKADADLARLAVAGDSTAERELLAKYQTVFLSLYNSMYRHLHREADDCVQEALIKLSRGLPGFRPERGPFGKWAQAVAKSAFRTYLKKHVAKQPVISLDRLPEGSISTRLGPEEVCFYHLLRKGVQELEPDQSAAVSGHYYYGLKDKEIAALRRMERRRVGYRREQGERNLGKRFRNSPLMSIRPKPQFS